MLSLVRPSLVLGSSPVMAVHSSYRGLWDIRCHGAYPHNEILDSKRALEIGLVSKLVDLADLASEALILAEKIARQPSVATKYAKRLVRDGFRSQLNQHLELASVYQGVTQRTPDHFNALAELEKKD